MMSPDSWSKTFETLILRFIDDVIILFDSNLWKIGKKKNYPFELLFSIVFNIEILKGFMNRQKKNQKICL